MPVDRPIADRLTLAALLRYLREQTGMSQKTLAKALDVSTPSISSWERKLDSELPPTKRIRQYAEFFAPFLSVDDAGDWVVSAVPSQEMPEHRIKIVEDRLLRLRAAALQSRRSRAGTDFWSYPAGHHVIVVAAQLPEELRARMPYTNPDDADYVELYNFADPDALVEISRYLYRANPDDDLVTVEWKRSHELTSRDLTTDLIVLGGVDWNTVAADMMYRLDLPVKQHSFFERGELKGSFEVVDPPDEVRTYQANLVQVRDRPKLITDVALFARAPNPYNPAATVTMCNGLFGRGTLGAVLALTDRRTRETNSAYLRSKFPPESTYCLLFNVHVGGGRAVPPNWADGSSVLYEWSESR
ncbi:helix-turn-helix domain-containing protein [Paractinoplanes maris]|uniref:helix-turn-helix domain-containing protein n=1 Tax=Paractinoplanes maris TaxID=1734446 RepID=UPI0020206C9D|nr:helix-turn-helix transcriptional regulator [Actinoplanes maris]